MASATRAALAARAAPTARLASAVLAAVIGLSLLAGCGYRLGDGTAPGGEAIPASLARLSLEGMKRHAPLRQALKSALRAHGVEIVAPVRAPARLVVGGEQISQRPVVIGDDAKTREYLLTAVVEFSVRGSGGVLLEKQRVESAGSYLYDAKRPQVGDSERERTLQHIRRDLARRIIGRLAAPGAPAGG
ncbi:MAG: LPS assembly lipoprotein LptE [Gammaproteobacteria bacterium]|nr:LPS assembly lipoprotein LptE [Gammaproteobacteria bacterium]